MSRRDFIAAATIIRTTTLTPTERDHIAARCADYFEDTYARFDRSRFLDAASANDWPHRNPAAA